MRAARLLTGLAAAAAVAFPAASASAAPSSSGCVAVQNVADATYGVQHTFSTYGVDVAYSSPAGTVSPIYNGGIYANC
jgi:hypothetical protein